MTTESPPSVPIPTPAAEPAPTVEDVRLREIARRVPACVFEVVARPGAPPRATVVGDGVSALLGLRAEDVLAAPERALAVLHPDDRARLPAAIDTATRAGLRWHDELRVVGADGHTRWLALEISPESLDDGGVRWQGWALDVTARRRAEAEVQRLAYYDPLTQLPNRRLLADRLRQSLAASQRNARHGAVLCVDLDDFKRINDTRGHPVGDEVLIEAAARMTGCVRAEDTVARVGDDEFVVVVERLDHDARQAAVRADETAHRLLAALGRPFDVPGMRFHSSASVGVALFGGRDARAEDVLMHADSAMYRAKAAGRGTVRFFDPAMQVAMRSRAALEADLRRALSEGQLRLAYQAQV